MKTTGSEKVDAAIARLREAAAKHDSGDLPLLVDGFDHLFNTLAEIRKYTTEQFYIDLLGRKWVRDNPGKARAELAKVDASR